LVVVQNADSQRVILHKYRFFYTPRYRRNSILRQFRRGWGSTARVLRLERQQTDDNSGQVKHGPESRGQTSRLFGKAGMHENLFHTNAENEDEKSPELDKVRGGRRMFLWFVMFIMYVEVWEMNEWC
jgi:hypothetical protein